MSKLKQAILFLSVLLIWIGLVAFQVSEASFGFIGSGVSGLILIAALASFFVFVIIAIKSHRWRDNFLFGTFSLVAFSACFTAGFISDRQSRMSIEAAQSIIAAAEQFHASTGGYPQSLDELVPAYLPGEPRTRMGLNGTPFRLTSRSDKFFVTFDLPCRMLYSYDSQSKQWSVRD